MADTPSISNQDEPIVDGEIVSEDLPAGKQEKTANSDDQSTVITSLDELIKTHIASIDRLSEEKKKIAEMLADGFNNSAAFKEADVKVKEATKIRSQVKSQITQQPAVLELTNKLKNVNSELKEKKVSLSDYLLEYQRMTGVTQIEGSDGEVREIVHSARLVKKVTS